MIRKDRRALTLWFALIAANVLGTFLAIRLYGESFHFWRDPFSALGGAATMGGRNNAAGLVAFVATMAVSGACMIGLFVVELQTAAEPRRPGEVPWFLRALLLVGGVGYWIAAVPYDLVHPLHSVGSGMAVASLYGWAIYFLLEMAETLPHRAVVLLHGALHWSVLGYALLFAFGRVEKQGVQKAAFLMLLFALLAGVLVERREAAVGARPEDANARARRRSPGEVRRRGKDSDESEPSAPGRVPNRGYRYHRVGSVAERRSSSYPDTTEE